MTTKHPPAMTYRRENTYNVTINDAEGFEIAKLCKYTWGSGDDSKPKGFDEFYDIKAIEKRAAFIVQACSSHKALLKMLKRWEEYAQDNLYSENEDDAGFCSFLADTRKAIAKGEA